MRRLKVFHKLLISYVGIGIAVMLVTSVVYHTNFLEAITERSLYQLESVNELKGKQLRSFVKESINKYSNRINNRALEGNFLLTDTSGNLIRRHGNIQLPEGHASQITVYNTTDTIKVADGLTIAPFKEVYIAFQGKLSGDTIITFLTRTDPIDHILHERAGMGLTGESYLVGEDKMMRTASRFYPDTNPLTIRVNTYGVQQAEKGKSGKEVILDYREEEVLSAYRTLSIDELKWYLLSEIDKKEIVQPLKQTMYQVFLVLIVVAFMVLIIAFLISNRISERINYLKVKIIKISKGQIPNIELETTEKDEIYEMQESVALLCRNFNTIINFSTEIGKGNFQAGHIPLSDKDLLSKALIQMRDELKQLSENNIRLEKESKRALIRGEEKERGRVAKEIHDGLGPLLTTIKLQLSQVDLPEDDSKLNLKNLVNETITETRRLANNLMPAVLRDFGIFAALKHLVKSVEQSSDIKIQYAEESTGVALSSDARIALYRVCQEALNNTLKYSKATKIALSLTQFEDSIHLFIKDDGVGIVDLDTKVKFSETNGLRNMRERVEILKGTFDISSDESGTTIEVELPIEQQAHDAD